MAEEVKNHCSGDCRKCHPVQRMYCSTQIGYNNMKMLEEMREEIVSLKQEIASMKSSEVEVLFNPTAQEGEAVQIIDSPDNQITE